MIDTDRLLAEVTGSTGTLADITTGTDQAAQVPTCPDWTFRQLITHVGRAHRWAAEIVATQAAEPIPFREVPDGRLPDDPAERPQWLRRGAAPKPSHSSIPSTAITGSITGRTPRASWPSARCTAVS